MNVLMKCIVILYKIENLSYKNFLYVYQDI